MFWRVTSVDTSVAFGEDRPVLVCAACGLENPEGARFCNGCAAALVGATPSREVRKTVSVLFCDIAGYPSTGDRLVAGGHARVPVQDRQQHRRIVDEGALALELEQIGWTLADGRLEFASVSAPRPDAATQAVPDVRTAVVLTALPLETQAVIEHLDDAHGADALREEGHADAHQLPARYGVHSRFSRRRRGGVARRSSHRWNGEPGDCSRGGEGNFTF